MDKFLALSATNSEPEYKQKPYLPISSLGTDYTKADETHLPYGSALMTDTLDGKGNGTSVLNSKGITHIIHAAPQSRSYFSTNEDFIDNIVKAVQNCIFLADREDIQAQTHSESLAICFVGGELFLGSCNPRDLAEGIITGAVNQLARCKNLNRLILI